jgi:hypothetical protein
MSALDLVSFRNMQTRLYINGDCIYFKNADGYIIVYTYDSKCPVDNEMTGLLSVLGDKAIFDYGYSNRYVFQHRESRVFSGMDGYFCKNNKTGQLCVVRDPKSYDYFTCLGRVSFAATVLPRFWQESEHEVLPGNTIKGEVKVFDKFYKHTVSVLLDSCVNNTASVTIDQMLQGAHSVVVFGEKIQERLPSIYAHIARKHPDFLSMFAEALELEAEDVRKILQEKDEYTDDNESAKSTVVYDENDLDVIGSHLEKYRL